MRKVRFFFALATLGVSFAISGCQSNDLDELNVDKIEHTANTDIDGNNGSGGGHNPPPSSNR